MSSLDYRLPENRKQYFTELYAMNLEHGVMPGLVYLYMPELKQRFGWDNETALWFATLNGFTQSPITSLRMMHQLDHVPTTDAEVNEFEAWFNTEWPNLHFDADRLKNKRNTVPGIRSYMNLVKEYGSQTKLFDPLTSYEELWSRVSRIYGMGRLSCFSYLEYIKIMGYGTECTDLMLMDKDGSRSHRNGMLFLVGWDDLVWDKRANNGFDGKYENFNNLCKRLNEGADNFLRQYKAKYPKHEHAGYFTFESQCCQFKNGFFGRRYPGVYADMAWDRIKWYDDRDMAHWTTLFKAIREDRLPKWLREECEAKPIKRSDKANQFKLTGTPFRAEHFLGENTL